jgi:hypothetical protein
MNRFKLQLLTILLTFSFSQETITIQGVVDGLFYIPECMCAPVGIIDSTNNVTALGTTEGASIAFQTFVGSEVIVTGIPTSYPCTGFCDETMQAIDVFSITPVGVEPCEPSCDINNDNTYNVLDIVNMVNFILLTDTPTEAEFCASDFDSDGALNVLDVVSYLYGCFVWLPTNP